MLTDIELEPLRNDSKGSAQKWRVAVLVFVVLSVAAIAAASWSKEPSTVFARKAPTALKVVSPNARGEEWKQCAARLSQQADDERLTSNFPKTDDAKLYTVNSKTERQSEEKLSAEAVPRFSCTTQHKVSMLDEKTLGFAYPDKKMVTVDVDSCKVTGVYASSKDGGLHPVAAGITKKSSAVWKDNPACQTIAEDKPKLKAKPNLCLPAFTGCLWNEMCCTGHCSGALGCLQSVGGVCLYGAQCSGFNLDRPNSKQCCYKKCQHNYPYPGQSSGVCGPRTTSIVVSDYNTKKHMDVASWAPGTAVVMYYHGGNKKWFIYHTPAWRVVQSADRTDRVWRMNSKALEIGTHIKNDCNQLFKFEHRGGGKYVIKNKCSGHCLDLVHDNVHSAVVSAPCHYHTAQLWTLG